MLLDKIVVFARCGVEVWSTFRPNFDPPVSKFGLIDDDRNNQQIAYLFEHIVYLCGYNSLLNKLFHLHKYTMLSKHISYYVQQPFK